MTAPESDESLLDRLHRSELRNREVFTAAGISSDTVGIVRCKACGVPENALFWRYEGRKGSKLLLRCPTCDGYTYKYPLTPGNSNKRFRFKLFQQADTVVPAFFIGALLFLGIASVSWEQLEELRWRAADRIAGVTQRSGSGAMQISPRPSVSAPTYPGVPGPFRGGDPPPTLTAPSGSYVTGSSGGILEIESLWRTEPPPETTLVYVRAGDQREAIAELDRTLLAESSDTISKQWEVYYDAARDQSRITIAGASPAWQSWLAEQGWHRVDRSR